MAYQWISIVNDQIMRMSKETPDRDAAIKECWSLFEKMAPRLDPGGGAVDLRISVMDTITEQPVIIFHAIIPGA